VITAVYYYSITNKHCYTVVIKIFCNSIVKTKVCYLSITKKPCYLMVVKSICLRSITIQPICYLVVTNKICYWSVTRRGRFVTRKSHNPPCQTLYNIKVSMYTYTMRLERLKQRSQEANNGKIYFNKKINRGDN